MMNVLVIGSGGREHALIWKIKQSDLVETVFAAPGNAGTASIAQNIALTINHPNVVIEFCKANNVGLVVIGPEAPLVDGLADHLRQGGLAVFGPNKLAAQVEGSKDFTKQLCFDNNIPTAASETFTESAQAKAYIESLTSTPIVVKADGLAAGKGVVIAQSKEEAIETVEAMLDQKQFGAASEQIVIEEFLVGEELSFFALVDGNSAIAFASAQDHKAVGEGDTGPNTGGMGTYSPAPVLNPALEQEIMDSIVTPTVEAMKKNGYPYQGILFVGLMITKDGPKVLEYNARFGDPETQSLMARLQSDIVPLMLATDNGTLADYSITLKPQAALCVVMAANGYPGAYEKGSIIRHLDRLDRMDDVVVFHAGTHKNSHDDYIANGGRVLGVTALGDTVTEAQKRAYEAVDKIEWNDGFCRRDIGWRAVERES